MVKPIKNGIQESKSKNEMDRSIIENPSKNKESSTKNGNSKQFEADKRVDQVKRKRGRPRKTEFAKPVDIQKTRDIEQQPIGRYNLRQHPKQTRF